MVIDKPTDEVRKEPPWTMMLADGIVICIENREQVEVCPGKGEEG